MQGLRNARLLEIHYFTWTLVVGMTAVGLMAQIDDVDWDHSIFMVWFYGWPMKLYDSPLEIEFSHWELVGFDVDNDVPSPLATTFNCIFYALLIRAVAYVSERLVREWRKPSQISLAALVWVSSVTAGTLAIFSQDYWSVAYAVFKFLHIRPQDSDAIAWYLSVPSYLAIACALYWMTDSLLRFCIGFARRSRRMELAS